MFAVPQESDSLSSLEERIQRAVKLVARLRQEKEAALAEASAPRETPKPAPRPTASPKRSAPPDRTEAGANRIERLLGQIDELNAG